MLVTNQDILHLALKYLFFKERTSLQNENENLRGKNSQSVLHEGNILKQKNVGSCSEYTKISSDSGILTHVFTDYRIRRKTVVIALMENEVCIVNQ